MRITVLLYIVSLTGLSAPGAQAQSYPAKPIRFVVPVVAGGSNDILGRLIGDRLRER